MVEEELVLQKNIFCHLFWISANMEMWDGVHMFFYFCGMFKPSMFH